MRDASDSLVVYFSPRVSVSSKGFLQLPEFVLVKQRNMGIEARLLHWVYSFRKCVRSNVHHRLAYGDGFPIVRGDCLEEK
jgi:hypothetical protein